MRLAQDRAAVSQRDCLGGAVRFGLDGYLPGLSLRHAPSLANWATSLAVTSSLM
jgi:hypothetical protein